MPNCLNWTPLFVQVCTLSSQTERVTPTPGKDDVAPDPSVMSLHGEHQDERFVYCYTTKRSVGITCRIPVCIHATRILPDTVPAARGVARARFRIMATPSSSSPQ